MSPETRPLAVTFAGLTHRGRVRSENQDAIFLPRDPDPALPLLFGLADGMGGAQGGKEASRLAIATLPKAFLGAKRVYPLGDSLWEAVQWVNTAVHEKARHDPALDGMGTTLVALALAAGRGALANVGDSRIYLWREGELKQLSQDHSLVGEQVRRGAISPEQAREHAMRNVLTRALGVNAEVEVDIHPVTLLHEDMFLLCSDGLHGPLQDADLAAILDKGGEPSALARALVEAANRAGGPDNISLVLVRVDDPGRTEAPPDSGGSLWKKLGGLLQGRK